MSVARKRMPGRAGLALLALAAGLLLAAWEGAARAAETEAVPGHVQAVTAAIKMRLAGATEAEVESALGVVRGSAAVAPEAGFRFEGFALRRAVYAGYSPPDAETSLHYLSGFLQFSDAIDRRVSVAFGVAYAVEGDTSVIVRASWRTATPAEPAVEAYFVPSEKMTEGEGAADALGFYDHVVRNAVPAAGAEPYWIVVFLKDRLEADAVFQVATSDSQDGTEGNAGASRYLLNDGWITVVIADPRDPSGKPPRFAKANYTPGVSVPEAERTEHAVAVFSLSPN